jgi:hypothetical protein
MSYKMSMIALVGMIAVWGCSSTTTTGWGGVTIQAPASLTHGACGAFTLQHTSDAVGDDSPQAAPSAETLTVTGTNGAIFIDSTCSTPAPGGAISFPAGSVSVPFGFMPTQAGSCNITVSGPANSDISSNVTVTAS